MALSVFEDKQHPPNENDLKTALKKSYKSWDKLKAYVLQKYPSALQNWSYAGAKYGWSFRLKDKKRAILYLIPCERYFKAALVFGQKATDEALGSNISPEIKEIINSARVYAEGRGFRIDVMNDESIDDIKRLIDLKLSN